jgi:hypothetical protein
MREPLSALHQRIFQGEQAKLKADDFERAITAKDTELHDRQELIQERDAELFMIKRELQTIQQSTGYRLLLGYRRAIRTAFPARSIRGLPYRALRRVIRALLVPDRKRAP